MLCAVNDSGCQSLVIIDLYSRLTIVWYSDDMVVVWCDASGEAFLGVYFFAGPQPHDVAGIYRGGYSIRNPLTFCMDYHVW